MTEKERLFREIYAEKIKGEAYINSIPRDIRDAIFDNGYVNGISRLNVELRRSVFGKHFDSIEWFLYEWEAGYEVAISTGDARVEVKIESIDDYVTWMKTHEGFE